MPHYSVKPLHVALRPLRVLGLLWGSVCVLLLVQIVLLPLPLWSKALGVLVAIFATANSFSQYTGLRFSHSVIALEVGSKGELRCFTRAHDWRDAEVLGSCFVTPWLMHARQASGTAPRAVAGCDGARCIPAFARLDALRAGA